MLEITAVEVKEEIARRQENIVRPISLFCPLVEIERCNQVEYSNNRCLGCRTAIEFIEICPAKNVVIEDLLDEKLKKGKKKIVDNIDDALDIKWARKVLIQFFDSIIGGITRLPDGIEQLTLEALSGKDLQRLSVLVDLKEEIKACDPKYDNDIEEFRFDIICEVEKLVSKIPSKATE